MLNLIGVKTKECLFITDFTASSYSPYKSVNEYLFDGKKPEKTFLKEWCSVQSEPSRVERIVRQPRINHRYVLKEDAPWVDGSSLPKEMPKAEVMDDKDGYCEWKDEFKHLQSLYEEISDEQPDKIEPVEFEYKTIFEVDEIKNKGGFRFAAHSGFAHTGIAYNVGEKEIRYQDFARIIFPEVLLPNTECALTSKHSYDIIRAHVKANIDTRYAEIDSDHDFCFGVSKVVPLSVHRHIKREIKNAKGKSYVKPRYREYTIKDRKIGRVFAIGHAENPHNGYQTVKGFRGSDQDDLKRNIDEYLDDLMARINEPVIDCPHCNGMGVIVNNG